MAALAPPFILCPLADSKDLVGFSQDHAENKIILTLDRNIAILYSVADQKQETSWTSRRHWFTSKVVYCSEVEKYGAAIDDNMICLWEENDTTLVRSKKHKFSVPVLELIPTSTCGTLLLFQNGFVTTLSKATSSNGKSLAIDGPVDLKDNRIVDYYVNEKRNTIFFIVGSKSTSKTASKCGVEIHKNLKVYSCSVGAVERDSTESKSFSEIAVEFGSVGTILGSCIISNDLETYIVFIKSNGNVYKQSLLREDKNADSSLDVLPKSTKIASFEHHVSLNNPLILRPSNSSVNGDDATVICFACDSAEEGAVVFIYDLTYDLVLAKQPLKLFSLPPIMAKISNNVFIPLGFNILVVGIRHTKSLLSSVVGRHQIQGIDFFESRDPWKAGWEQRNAKLEPKVKESLVEDLNETVYDGIDLTDIQDIVNTLERNGHPESLICAQVIPQAVEKGNDTALSWILEYFEDIPEKYLIELIVASLTRKKHNSMDVDGVNHEDGNDIVERIFQRTFDRVELIRSLKSIDFNCGKKLLEILINLMENEPLVSIQSENTKLCISNEKEGQTLSNLIKWSGAVLDAQYTNLVFNSETELVDRMLKLVNERMLLMKEIEQLEPLVDMVINKTKLEPRPNPNSIYRVETVMFR